MPELDKRLIYLDQNAVSEMMKSLNPATRAHQAGRVRPFWDQLFEKLDRLCKLQLIACPESAAHVEESQLFEHAEALRQMYEHLACGLSFLDDAGILRFQVQELFEHWLDGTIPFQTQITRESVIHGGINDWLDRIRISVHSRLSPELVADSRAGRRTIHEGFLKIVERWKTERGRTFDEWYQDEVLGSGEGALASYRKYLSGWMEVTSGTREMSLGEVFSPSSVTLIHGLLRAAKYRGVSEDEAPGRVGKFFGSTDVSHAPAIRIAACLYAKMAESFAAGRQRAPTPGFATDVSVVSSVYPYCDALFLDNEVAEYLADGRVQAKLGETTRVFSSKTGEAFLSYLDEIEKAANPELLKAVLDVYGPQWPEPYRTMYRLQDESSQGHSES